MSGCATYEPVGQIYTNVQGLPKSKQYNNDVAKNKISQACALSVLGLVAAGDMSVETAAEKAGIKKIHSVNYKVQNVLGLIGEYCTVVKGS